jgi:hypothetical protein
MKQQKQTRPHEWNGSVRMEGMSKEVGNNDFDSGVCIVAASRGQQVRGSYKQITTDHNTGETSSVIVLLITYHK